MTIVNDRTTEPTEHLNVSIGRTAGLNSRIQLIRQNGVIEIHDDDGVFSYLKI